MWVRCWAALESQALSTPLGCGAAGYPHLNWTRVLSPEANLHMILLSSLNVSSVFEVLCGSEIAKLSPWWSTRCFHISGNCNPHSSVSEGRSVKSNVTNFIVSEVFNGSYLEPMHGGEIYTIVLAEDKAGKKSANDTRMITVKSSAFLFLSVVVIIYVYYYIYVHLGCTFVPELTMLAEQFTLAASWTLSHTHLLVHLKSLL